MADGTPAGNEQTEVRTRTDPPETGRSYQVLRHHDFRLLWAGEFISTSGSQIQRVAIAWQVFRLTDDPVQLGLLGLCRFVPIILFGLVGGVMADQGDRRRTLLITQTILLSISAGLALMTWADAVSILVVYALVVVGAIVESIANPTRQALIPLLVPRAQLPAASTMSLIAFNVAAVGGPAMGGLIIGFLGVGTAYFIDALSFLATIFAVLWMRARPSLPPLAVGGFAAAMEGLRFLRSAPVLLGVMMTDFLATLFGASSTLMPIFAERVLDAGPGGLGLLLSAPAAGAVVMAILLGLVRMPDRTGTWFMVAVGLYGACLIGFGLSTHLWVSLLFLFGSGAADSFSMTLRHGMRNLLTPDLLRGRVAAVHRTLAAGGPQLGEFRGGIAASLMGVGPAVALGGLLTVATAAAIARLVPGIPAFKLSEATLPDNEPVVPPAAVSVSAD